MQATKNHSTPMGNSPSKKRKGTKGSKAEEAQPPPENRSEPQLNVNNPNPATNQPVKVDSPMKPPPATKSSSFKSEPDKGAFSIKKLDELFDKYKENEAQIGPEGVEGLCRDIGVEPENVVVLVLAWHLNAQSMGYFKKEEFVSGLQALSVDSVDKLKAQLNVFKSELDDPIKFKDIFRYAFGFAKEKEQKILDLATSDAMLDLLMGGRFPHTERLRQFLKEQTSYKSINLDQWMNILEFSRTIKADLSNYDENGAWPVLLDEYCEWARDR